MGITTPESGALKSSLTHSVTVWIQVDTQGYEDADKTGIHQHNGLLYQGKFGDLLIWKEILEKARSENRGAIVFVTADLKGDWWHKEKSQGEMTLGPRPELRSEIQCVAGTSRFLMYSIKDFLEQAQSHLHAAVNESSIEEINKASEEDEKRSQKQEDKFEAIIEQHARLNEVFDNIRNQATSNIPPDLREKYDNIAKPHPRAGDYSQLLSQRSTPLYNNPPDLPFDSNFANAVYALQQVFKNMENAKKLGRSESDNGDDQRDDD